MGSSLPYSLIDTGLVYLAQDVPLPTINYSTEERNHMAHSHQTSNQLLARSSIECKNKNASNNNSLKHTLIERSPPNETVLSKSDDHMDLPSFGSTHKESCHTTKRRKKSQMAM